MHCIIHIFIVYSTLKKHFSHLVQIGKDIFHLQFTKQKRLLDTYQEIDRKNSTFLFVQNHIVFATKLHFNSFIDYNRFQQMFYMIITANICISKWCLSKFIGTGTKSVTSRNVIILSLLWFWVSRTLGSEKVVNRRNCHKSSIVSMILGASVPLWCPFSKLGSSACEGTISVLLSKTWTIRQKRCLRPKTFLCKPQKSRVDQVLI